MPRGGTDLATEIPGNVIVLVAGPRHGVNTAAGRGGHLPSQLGAGAGAGADQGVSSPEWRDGRPRHGRDGGSVPLQRQRGAGHLQDSLGVVIGGLGGGARVAGADRHPVHTVGLVVASLSPEGRMMATKIARLFPTVEIILTAAGSAKMNEVERGMSRPQQSNCL